ncbi:MAG: chromate transporter [Burkholderiales bacterium]|nr:chromate transporter [Burkholderiales bacterium]
MTLDVLAALCAHLALLSLFAIGGAHAVLPDVHRIAVGEHGWLSDTEFATLVALSQAAPGPNVLVMSLIGYQLGGLAGALAATIAFVGPSSLLVAAVAKTLRRAGQARWVRVLTRALAPLTVGLVLASGYVLSRGVFLQLGGSGTGRGLAAAAITLGVALLGTLTRINPLWLILTAAVAGIVLF